jgi:hypothetical protein
MKGEEPMLKQYSVVTKCLSELKKSDLPIIEKLKLEVQLIQTKRLLLDCKVEYRIAGVASSERDFDSLYEKVRHACNTGGADGTVECIKVHILEIKARLNGEPTGKTVSPQQVVDSFKSPVATRNPLYSVKDIFHPR